MKSPVEARRQNRLATVRDPTTSRALLVSRFETFSRLAGALVTGIGSLVLLGWSLDVAILKSGVPGTVTQKPNAALAFVLTGASLLLLQSAGRGRHRIAGLACAAITLLIGLATAGEYVSGLNVGFDTLVFDEASDAVDTAVPGRMALTTAMCFVLTGLALIALDVETRGARSPSQFFALATMAASTLTLLGYTYGTRPLVYEFFPESFSAVSILDASAVLLLSAGILAATAGRGVMNLLVSDAAGGVLLRRLLAPLLFLPALLGLLRLEGERAGFYDTGFGVALTASASMLLAIVLLLFNARALDRAEDERRRSATELARSTERLAEAQAIAHVGSWEWEMAADELSLSTELCRIYGLPHATTSYVEFQRRLPLDDRERIRGTIERAMSDGEPFALDHRIVRTDGELRMLHWRGEVVRDHAGTPIRMVGTAQDITERNRVEEKLREREEHYRSIVDTASDAFVSTDATGLITDWNRAAELAFGWPSEDAIGRPLGETIIPPAHRDPNRTGLQRFLDTGNGPLLNRRLELVALHREGREVPVELTVWPVRSGNAWKFNAFLRDVSERKAAEEELRRSREHYRESVEILQRSLLPKLPDIPGIDVAACYAPAGTGSEIGGDWYDVLALPGGNVGMAIGDVVGRGFVAASVMGEIRNALRAYALEGLQPATVLDRLNRLVGHCAPEEMATIVYASFDPTTCALRFVRAGHPPPLLVAPDGAARYLESGLTLPLGARHARRKPEGDELVPPGSTLLFYTDGLVEERGAAMSEGLARLKRAAASGPGGLEALCEHILGACAAREDRMDDVALLAVRPTPALVADRLELNLPADPDVLAPLRAMLRRWLEKIDAGADDAHAITLACCEAAANAIEHAYGLAPATFRVEAALDGSEAVVGVRDFGRWRGPRGRNRGRGMKLMDAFMDRVEIRATEDGTEVCLRRRIGEVAGR